MSVIPKYKFGNCSACSATNTNVIKVKKDLFCVSCHKKNKTLEQIEKQKKRNAAKLAATKLKTVANTEEVVKALKDYADLDVWFKNTRKKLTGICQCGCNKPSSKMDNKYFKFSCAHVFPKSKFESVKTHPRNFVERAFFGGCHSVMDDTSMDRWVTFADWENIKEIFHELAPILTDKERSTKFYTHFEKLIYSR